MNKSSTIINFLFKKLSVILISLCYISSTYAQTNMSQRISDAITSQNPDECKILMKQITDSEIKNMPDSTLFEYYYLAGFVAMETDEIEEQINYLTKAKDICETKLGINNNVFLYFEIIKALGEACEELGKDDEAILWYEEGIVKGLPYLQVNDETIQSYFYDIFKNLADIYEEKGHNDIAEYLRRSKILGDYISSFDYAYELLMKAIQLNNEDQCNEAINLLDEAKEIFKKHDDEGREMIQLLYREYLRCYARIGDTKKIDALLKAKRKTMFYDGTESFLITDMQEVISIFILNHYDVKTAEYYYQWLLKEVDSKELERVKTFGKSIDYFKNVYFQIDSLESVKAAVPLHSYEWGIISLQQANLLYDIRREDDANKICEQVYEMSATLNKDPENMHWIVLMNLSDYHLNNNNWDNAERYLNEQLAWLDSHNIPSDAGERGWVYNGLCAAYMYRQNYVVANEMIIKTEQILLPIYGLQSEAYATILHNKGRLLQLEGKLDEAKQILEEAIKIQIEVNGKALDRTVQYLDEVNHAINIRL